MKNFFRIALGLLLLLSVVAQGTLIIPKKAAHYVNDYAKLLHTKTVQELDQTLQKFDEQTSNQIVVAIFPSLEGGSLEDISIRIAQQWKIGSKKNNNGILLTIFVAEHKVRIEVGYGLEGALPDALASEIIRAEMTPEFRAEKFDQGVKNGVNAIIKATQHEYHGQPHDDTYDSIILFCCFVLVLIFLALMFPGAGILLDFYLCNLWGGPPALVIALVVFGLIQYIHYRYFYSRETLRKGQKAAQKNWYGYWGGFGGGGSGSSNSWSSGDSSFSGGGGSFGGGGASGDW